MTGIAEAFQAHATELLPEAGAVLLVAVSGGADSMALWDLLVRANRWHLALFHLDHGLRADAARDAEVIRAQAAAYVAAGFLATRLILERADVPALAREWRCGFEAAGRRQRYARLRALAVKHRVAAVLTAHHRDDQAETVLANLLRGAGPPGKAGIPPRRQLAPRLPLVRPLLPFTRGQLREHCARQGVAWHEDASNDDLAYQRNWLRHRVLPALEAGVPGFGAELARLAADNRTILAESEGAVTATWRRALADDDLLTDGVMPLPEAQRLLVWRRLLQHLSLPIERQHLRRLDELARGASGRRFALGRWLFLRRPHALAWELAQPRVPSGITLLTGPGEYDRGWERMRAGVEVAPFTLSTDRHHAMLAAEACAWPLAWRLSEPGERWLPLGAPGRQTVVKFLSTRGVSSRLRALTPVVADRDGIVWVPGHAIAERVRVTAATVQALHLRWHPAGQDAQGATMPATLEEADDDI
jgi:tRNA(Ile)-lysidine synthase